MPQSEHTKAKNRRGKGLAASRGHNEARRRAYGDRDSTKHKFDLEGDLGGCCGSARMAICSRVGGRGLRRSGGRYLKPPRRARQASRRDRAWPVRNLHRVQLGYEGGDGTDRWAPPGSDSGRETCLSVKERGGRWRSAAGPDAGAGPRCEERKGGGKEVGRPREKKGVGRAQEQRGRESFSFYFLFLFSFKTNLFQNIFKTKFKFLFKL